ncbi:hypothetical protein CFC21_065794, partial [Triticum aestivum]
IVTMQRESG